VRGQSKVERHNDGPTKIASVSDMRSTGINLSITTVYSPPLSTSVSNSERNYNQHGIQI
jgi:hypothetical protein